MLVLTEVEGVAAAQWARSGNYTTYEIAAKILVGRYQSEYDKIREEILG